MSNKYSSLTMNILLNQKSITVSYNKEFMLPFMFFLPAFLGMLLYQHTFPAILKWVLVFFFVALLSGLIAHLKSFMRGEDVFLWKVEQAGFHFQAQRTNFLSLKTPVFQDWSNIAKVLYAKKYVTVDHELDTVTLKNVILLFSVGNKKPKTLEYPYKKDTGLELFKVIQAFSPASTNFEFLDVYNDT